MESRFAVCAGLIGVCLACARPDAVPCNASTDCPTGAACQSGLCQEVQSGGFPDGGGTPQLIVTKVGSDASKVTSTPAGIDCGATCTSAFTQGETVTLTAVAAAGAQFAGWSEDCKGTDSSTTVTINGTRRCTASFTSQGSANLVVNRTGTGAGTVTSAPPGVDCGATCSANFPAGTQVTLTAAAAQGSKFDGWSGDCSGTAATAQLTLQGNKTCTATFTATDARLTVTKAGDGAGSVSSNPPGIDCGGACSATFAVGANVTLTAAPAAGSTFSGWSGDCTGTAPAAQVTMAGPKTCTATFAKIGSSSLTVTKNGTGTGSVTSNPPGIDCGTACAATYQDGTAVTLTAAAGPNSTFGGWGGDCSGTAPTATVTVAGNKTCTAKFDTNPPARLTVTKAGNGLGTVTSAPPGIDCGTNCSATFPRGSAVTLSALPAINSAFTGWSGACTGTAACVVTLDADKTVTATFARVPRVAFHSTRALDGSNAPNPQRAFNIWRVDLGGGPPQAVTLAAATNSFFPRWSSDGFRLVFNSNRKVDGSDTPNAAYNIWRADADGTHLTPLTKLTAANANSTDANWSADDGRVTYHSSRALDGSDAANPSINIWVMNADGGAQAHLTNLTVANGAAVNPRFRPDGTRLVFSSNQKLDRTNAVNPASNIWEVNADGTGLSGLTAQTAVNAVNTNPEWSPDGRQVIYVSSRRLDATDNVNNTTNIWLLHEDSTTVPLTRATAANATSGAPQWSPNGTKIVFHSKRALDGTDAAIAVNNIWVVNADGTGLTALTRLTATGADSVNPRWTADGTQIVYSSGRKLDGSNAANGVTNIWRMNADGSAPTALTNVTATDAGSDFPAPTR